MKLSSYDGALASEELAVGLRGPREDRNTALVVELLNQTGI
jgi:hypothetical protein